ncbi:MAG: glycoside hydrolase family 38 N-terminal domain-containing protein [Armatimonadota bacterium]
MKTIYIMQFSHLDIGYTHPQSEVAAQHVVIIDHVMEFCAQDPEYRWTVESLWQLEQWMNNRSQEKINKFFALVKSGQISLGACYAGLHSGLMGSEEFSRSLYFADKLRRDYGVEINTAIQNDIAGYSWAYPQVLRKSGIKYFVTGINTFIGAGADVPVKDRVFFWEGPDGSRILTCISQYPHIGGSGYLAALLYYDWAPGGHAEENIPAMLTRLEKSGYPYDSILVMSGGGKDNDDTSLTMLQGIREWNSKHKSPKMVLAAPDEFFKHISDKYGDTFPVYRGDWSGLWEQVKETLPYGTGLAREVHESLPMAESLAAFSDVLKTGEYPKDKLDSAWRNVITFEEHSGGGGIVPDYMTREQAEEESRTKLGYASDAHSLTSDVMNQSLRAVARGIKTDGSSVIVWNPASGKRSGVVQVTIDPKWMKRAFSLTGPDGKQVAYQKSTDGKDILFKADNIPGLGYGVFKLDEVTVSSIYESTISTSDNMLENEYVSVRVDSNGRIQSLFDKKLKREFVENGSAYYFGQLVHANEGQITNGQHDLMQLKHVTVKVGKSGPSVGSIVITDKESPLVSTEITLYAGSPSIYVTHTMDWSRMPKDNSRYDIVYPLNVPGGRLVFDSPAGLLDPKKDGMPKAWPIVHVNRGGDITGPDCGVTISSKQAFNWEFAKMNSYWGGILPPDSTTLMMRLTNNIDHGQYKGSGHGDYIQESGAPNLRKYENIFRLHGGSRKYGFDSIADTLYLESKPLIACMVERNHSGTLPDKRGQLIDLEGKGIELLAFKKAEDGDGYILRVMESHNRNTSLQLSSSVLKIKSAELLDNTEHTIRPLDVNRGGVKVPVGSREIVMLRVRLGTK